MLFVTFQIFTRVIKFLSHPVPAITCFSFRSRIHHGSMDGEFMGGLGSNFRTSPLKDYRISYRRMASIYWWPWINEKCCCSIWPKQLWYQPRFTRFYHTLSLHWPYGKLKIQAMFSGKKCMKSLAAKTKGSKWFWQFVMVMRFGTILGWIFLTGILTGTEYGWELGWPGSVALDKKLKKWLESVR